MNKTSFTMVKIVLSVLVVSAFMQGIRAPQWSASLTEDATVNACAGDVSVTFPWEITLAAGEDIAKAEWFYHGSSEEMIGTFTHGYYLAMPSFSQRVQRENVIGLLLRHVTDSDAGNYSVEVQVQDRTSGVMTTLRHTAVLVVYSQFKAVTDASVRVRQEPGVAIYDNVTGQFHVVLTCASDGIQPSAMIWTLPSGTTILNTSASESGRFSLLVPNPVSSGNYTCSVHPDTPAARCLPRDSPILKGDTITVDAVAAHLTLLEAKQQHLQSKNDALTAAVQNLQSQNAQQNTTIQTLQRENSQRKTESSQQATAIQTLQTENSQLKNRLDQHLHDMTTKRVAFHTRIASSTASLQVNRGAPAILDDVLYNQGNGYSKSTGIFTAPCSGTYTFLITTLPGGNGVRGEVDIMVDNIVVNHCKIWHYGDAQACNAVVHLNAAQRAWLQCGENGYFDYRGTAFSGFLISPDP